MSMVSVGCRRVLRETAIVLLLTLVAGAATKAFHPRSPAWYFVLEVGDDAVTEQMVQERWMGDVLWVDARPSKMYEKRHREGALLLNEEQWNDLLYEHFDKLASAGKPIIVYCDGTHCAKSKAVAEKLRGLGLPDVFYLAGGWR